MAINILPKDRVEELRHAFVNDLPMADMDMQALKDHCTASEWRDVLDARAERRATGKITPIGAGRTDQQIAKDYQDRMLALLEPVTALLNEAKRQHGMTIAFGYAPPNGFGIQTLASIEVSKKLC